MLRLVQVFVRLYTVRFGAAHLHEQDIPILVTLLDDTLPHLAMK